MENEFVSLETLGQGAAVERFGLALQEALDNIQDPNTNPKVKRTVTLKVTIKPTEERDVGDVSVDVAALLKVVGNVKEEAVTNFTDDGITQAVTAKAGLSTVALIPVPNPVTLRPYRTFMEVEQPASTFVFRMRGEKGTPPSCALFEADGRMWRLEAIKNIKEWLAEKIPGIKIIA